MNGGGAREGSAAVLCFQSYDLSMCVGRAARNAVLLGLFATVASGPPVSAQLPSGGAGAQTPADGHTHTHPILQSPVIPDELLNRPLPLREGIGRAHDAVTTASPEAQRYYDQALAYMHGYVWVEAARSLHQARRLDPAIVMADVALSTVYVELNQPARATEALARAAAVSTSLNAHDRAHLAARQEVRDLMKELVVGGVLRGRQIAQVEQMGESFADYVASRWLRTDTVERLRWHQRAGHRIVLVSASLSPYLRPLGRRLGVDGVLCAEPLRDGDAFGDGLDGGNCRAAEKVRRLESWLREHELSTATVWAYGDSAGDQIGRAHV